jgi:membrane protease YdiL (CAAX protease family)
MDGSYMPQQSMQHPHSLSTDAAGGAAYRAGTEPQLKLTLTRRSVLLVLAAGLFAVGLWPTWYVRDAVLKAFGAPAYQGVWILIPHALLYSTLAAWASWALWLWLARARWVRPPSLALNVGVAAWGVLGGLIVIAITVVALFALGYGPAFHAPRVNPWLMAGNAFSNFFEELIFRGFLLAALAAALGFWPAAILSSIAFGAVHTQFPFAVQVLVGVAGFVWCLVAVRGKSLLAPYISHMTLDWLIDPLL